MAALLVFKVWDSARKNKISVALTDNDDGMLYNQLVLKASEKLQMDGSKIVLECDGTLIDEDPVLRLLHTQVLLLLSKHQSWEPIDQSPATPLSLSSTITIGSTSPSRSPFQDITEIELNNTQMPTQGDDRVSESTWAHFVLPLHRLGKTLTEECVVGNRINKQAITEVVHIVVDAVREMKADAPSSAFKCLARKLVDQYPKMFEDRDEDGFIIGNGTHSIYNKLQERNHYLNRPHKRKSLKSTLPITPKQKKTMLTAKAVQHTMKGPFFV